MATWRVPNICDYSPTSPPVSRVSGIDFNGLVSMKERHTATVNALTTQRSVLSSQLDQSRANTEKLRLALDEAGGDAIRKASSCRREEFAWPLERRASMSSFDGGRSVLRKVSGEEMTRTYFWRICFVTPRGFQQTSMAPPSLWAASSWLGMPWKQDKELRLQTARRFELFVLLLIPAHQKNLPAPLASEKTRQDPVEVKVSSEPGSPLDQSKMTVSFSPLGGGFIPPTIPSWESLVEETEDDVE